MGHPRSHLSTIENDNPLHLLNYQKIRTCYIILSHNSSSAFGLIELFLNHFLGFSAVVTAEPGCRESFVEIFLDWFFWIIPCAVCMRCWLKITAEKFSFSFFIFHILLLVSFYGVSTRSYLFFSLCYVFCVFLLWLRESFRWMS